MAQTRELDLDFHSFCSVFTKAASSATADEFNPFDEDKHSSYSYEEVSSPDITYDKSDGTITFGAQGAYFVVCNMQCASSSGNGTVVGKIKLNGTDVITSESVNVKAAEDPKQLTLHATIQVNAGDQVTATFDGTGANFGVGKGTYITVFKCNGHFSSAFYTTKADDTSTASSYELYDTTNEGGVVNSTVNGITYAGGTGRFTTSATRTFLIFSTWILDSDDTVSDFFHKININGSTLDELTCGTKIADNPECHSYHAIKEITGGEYAAIVFDQGGTVSFTAEKGTSFSMIDISNSGVNPGSMICMTLNGDSNAMATDSGDKDIWDEDNYASFAKTDRVTTTNIVYTQADGKFTVNETGYYLVTNTTGFDSTSDGTPVFKLNKNGTTYYDANFDLRDDADPRTFALCLVVHLNQGDYLNFVVNNAGADFDDGSSVSMFKVDEIANLYQRTETTEEIIDPNTLLINNYSIDSLSEQHNRTVQKQVPFILGSRTPARLRGRRPIADSTINSVATEPGGKKN